jgi:hypothetical protein
VKKRIKKEKGGRKSKKKRRGGTGKGKGREGRKERKQANCGIGILAFFTFKEESL